MYDCLWEIPQCLHPPTLKMEQFAYGLQIHYPTPSTRMKMSECGATSPNFELFPFRKFPWPPVSNRETNSDSQLRNRNLPVLDALLSISPGNQTNTWLENARFECSSERNQIESKFAAPSP